MANTGKDAAGNTIFLRAPFGNGVDDTNAYTFGLTMYFQRNAAEQLVRLDTSTAANNRPLPIVVLAGDGLAPLDVNSGAAGATTLRSVLATRHEAAATPLSVQLSNGAAFLATGSGTLGSTVIRTVTATDDPIVNLLNGTTAKISTVTFTINNAASLSNTVDIGAGFSLLALILPSAWTAADLLFNAHPTTSGSVCQKLTTSGGAYRLAGIPTAAASNFRMQATDFWGDRFIQLSSVTVGATSAVNQGGSRTITGIIGVI